MGDIVPIPLSMAGKTVVNMLNRLESMKLQSNTEGRVISEVPKQMS